MTIQWLKERLDKTLALWQMLIKSCGIWLKKYIDKQECLPVGCVPSAAVVVPGGVEGGVYLGGVCLGKVST